MNYSESDKRYMAETKAALESTDSRKVLAKIAELRLTGNVNILPYLLELLRPNQKQVILTEVLNFIGELRSQNCVPIVVEYIKRLKGSEVLSGLISACWQSQLDYSEYLETFADCFVSGTYQDSIESFTVIEEMIMRSYNSAIESCRLYLLSRQSEINDEKKPLFKELIKLLLISN
jgi:hypothetical protein